MTNSSQEPAEGGRDDGTDSTADAGSGADAGGDSDSGSEQGYITDDQLPEDLRPDDDNPLAQNPEEGGDEATRSPGGALSDSEEDADPGPADTSRPT